VNEPVEPMDLAPGNELDRSECLRLLAGAVIGRVVNTENALPVAHPVTFALTGEEIVFRTAADGRLAAAATGAVVAFQVDDIDAERCTGWSVLGIGQAYQLTDVLCGTPLTDQDARANGGATTACLIRIPLSRLTGRRFGATPRKDG
jgi:hypothetical protein